VRVPSRRASKEQNMADAASKGVNMKQTNNRKPQRDKRVYPTEAQEQTTLFSWARMKLGKYPELRLLFAVPNGGTRDHIEAKHLKDQGVKSGVPDMFLPVARGLWHGLFIEMKRQKGGRVSDAQRRWLSDLERQGYRAEVACGWREAAQIIEIYLQGEIT